MIGMTKYEQLQFKVKKLNETDSITDYIAGFLMAYDIPRATLVRMRITEGVHAEDAVRIGNKLLISYTHSENLYTYYDYVQKQLVKNQNYRLILMLNEMNILAYDTINNDWLYIERQNLYKQCDFFYPLMGLERNVLHNQDCANIKIGEKFAQLYNELLLLNPRMDEMINNFIIDVLFCLLADSFDIIKKGSLYSWINKYTNQDGKNVGKLIHEVCEELAGLTEKYLETKTDIGEGFLQFGYENIVFDKSIRNILITKTSHTYNGIRTLKIQYFS